MKPQELIYARETGYGHHIGTGHDDTLLRPSGAPVPRLHPAGQLPREGQLRACARAPSDRVLDMGNSGSADAERGAGPRDVRSHRRGGATRPASGLGDTLEEVAEKLCIELTTARSQLAIIFSKAGIRRQTKLVAILSRIAHLERRAMEAA